MRISDWSSDVFSSDLVFLVANSDKTKAKLAAEELAGILQNNPLIATVELKRGVADQTSAGDFYFRHRHHLLSDQDAALLAAGNFQDFSDYSVQQAYAPFSGGLIDLVQNDPFLLSLRNAKDRKSVVEGKRVSVRVALGGRRLMKKKKKNK